MDPRLMFVIYVEMSVGNIFWLHALDALRGRSIRKPGLIFALSLILHVQAKSFSYLKVILHAVDAVHTGSNRGWLFLYHSFKTCTMMRL